MGFAVYRVSSWKVWDEMIDEDEIYFSRPSDCTLSFFTNDIEIL
jgi:hypothetical protein